MPEISVINADTPVELVADNRVAELHDRLVGLSAETAIGYQLVKAGISEVRKERTGVEQSRKDLKKFALFWGRKVDEEARRVTQLLLDIETPLRLEKAKVDDEAERLKKEKKDAERLVIEAKEQAEREAREAEESAKRYLEHQEREVAETKLAEERKEIEAERAELDKFRHEMQTKLEETQRQVKEYEEAIEERAREEREAKTFEKRKIAREERESIQKIEREQTAAADKVRQEEIVAESERLVEERKPDQQKLVEYAERLLQVELPDMFTDWGKSRLESALHLLSMALDCFRGILTEGDNAHRPIVIKQHEQKEVLEEQ